MKSQLATRVLLLFILCIASLDSISQNVQKLSREEMKSDIDYFFNNLRQYHANPYFFCSKDSIEQEKNRIVNNLPDSLSTYDFAKQIGTLNHLFDGHTGICLDFAMQDTTRKFIPAIFAIDNNYDLYIKDKFTNAKSKVVSINGHDVESIMSQFKKYMLNEQVKSSIRGNTFLFKYCLPLLGINEPHTIGVQHDGKQDLVNISEKISYTNSSTGYSLDFSSLYKNSTTADTIKSVNFKIDKTRSLAIMYYTKCDIDEDSVMQQKVKSFFKTIDSLKIEYLIIDIRNNSGGNSESNEYITDNIKHKTFTSRQTFERKIGQKNKDEAISKINSYRTKSFFHRMFYRQMMNHAFIEIHDKNIGELYKVNYRERVNANSTGYSGKIYLVQGYSSFSSALDVSYWFKCSKRGIIVGDETGEATDFFAGLIMDSLPKSKLPFMLAGDRYKYQFGNISTGIKPDRYMKLDTDEILLTENEISQIISIK